MILTQSLVYKEARETGHYEHPYLTHIMKVRNPPHHANRRLGETPHATNTIAQQRLLAAITLSSSGWLCGGNFTKFKNVTPHQSVLFYVVPV